MTTEQNILINLLSIESMCKGVIKQCYALRKEMEDVSTPSIQKKRTRKKEAIVELALAKRRKRVERSNQKKLFNQNIASC